MSKVAVVARIKVKPESREQVEAKLLELVGVVAGEEGTEQYVLHRDTADPDALWMYELYTDMGALGAHSGSPQLGELMAMLGDATAEPPTLTVLEPVAAKGLDLGG